MKDDGGASYEGFSRRRLLAYLTAASGSAVFARALVAQVAEPAAPAVTSEMIERAEWISGLELTPEERRLMTGGLAEMTADFERIRAVELDNAVAPALHFDPAPGSPRCPVERRPLRPVAGGGLERPQSDDELAFASVAELARLLASGQVSSVELTELYLARLRRFDPQLECVISLTEELARAQAARADRERAQGRVRGPLHGIPWGAKDLFAVPGTRTTWGAMPYKDQVRQEKATVVERLEQAGAVLVAKLTLGALAWGDVWFGGRTRNPWNPEQGSSGSSAGSASATAAGLVGFALGTETLGSIVSPCTRCGCSGLRPTFGRVSRYGAMALSWSMDKIGPICRSVEDCALVFAHLHGRDGKDATTVDRPFAWPYDGDPRRLRVGYVPQLFDRDRGAGIDDAGAAARAREWQAIDRRTLDELAAAGFELRPIELPESYPVGALSFILTAEAACAFDELTRSGRDELLVRQIERAWPNVFRQGQLIPAVEYLRANRIRTLLMAEMAELFEQVDVYLTPSFGGSNLLLTNLTGHPQVVLPNGFRDDGTPVSITFTGNLYGEGPLLAVAHAYQQATDYHRRRPQLG
ncbi:MAG: amidase [Acidobacteria bacterium]|nr:MAG: amidase [Acidobacteriota bacterium]